MVGRLGRFVVAVEVSGGRAPAHPTDTGRLRDYLVPGRRGLCVTIRGPKLGHRLVAVEDEGGYAISARSPRAGSSSSWPTGGLLP